MSQNNLIGFSKKTPKAAKRDLIQIISLVIVAIAQYLASVDECDTMLCFFVFHAIGDPPRDTRKPVKEHLVRGHAPQSES